MELTRRKKAGIIALVALVAFGVSQYVAATEIVVGVVDSSLVSTSAEGETYDLRIAVSNPTLLPISVGNTDFEVSKDGSAIGSGQIESFVMPVMGDISVDGTYTVSPDAIQTDSNVLISGTTEYSMIIWSISIPFEYDIAGGFIPRL